MCHASYGFSEGVTELLRRKRCAGTNRCKRREKKASHGEQRAHELAAENSRRYGWILNGNRDTVEW